MDKLAVLVDISQFSSIFTSEYSDISTFANSKLAEIINFATGFAALVAVIFLIIAGYTYITAAGDADKIEKAGKTITASIIGLVVVFIARILVELVIEKIMG